MHFLLVLVAFFVSNVSAQHESLAPNKWAYYGGEFYTALNSGRNIDNEFIHNILENDHIKTPGRFDVVTPHCTNSNCYDHKSLSYGEARIIMFGELDKQVDSNGTFVRDVYCGKKFYYSNLNNVSSMHTKVNIEHTWPQSKFSTRFNKEMQKSDMHHLFLADSKANSARGNSPFGLMEYLSDSIEGCHSLTSYSPPVSHRGNIARSLFYFSIRYKLPIARNEEAVLRRWHKEDPVDATEMARHEGIVRHQKIRNPFIDHPELADLIADF